MGNGVCPLANWYDDHSELRREAHEAIFLAGGDMNLEHHEAVNERTVNVAAPDFIATPWPAPPQPPKVKPIVPTFMAAADSWAWVPAGASTAPQ